MLHASLGEYNRVVKYSQLSWWRKLATIKSFKADVSSVSPSSKRVEELRVLCVCVCVCRKWSYATLLVGTGWRKNKNKISWMKSAYWYRDIMSITLQLLNTKKGNLPSRPSLPWQPQETWFKQKSCVIYGLFFYIALVG